MSKSNYDKWVDQHIKRMADRRKRLKEEKAERMAALEAKKKKDGSSQNKKP
jgi:hypothetical protein